MYLHWILVALIEKVTGVDAKLRNQTRVIIKKSQFKSLNNDTLRFSKFDRSASGTDLACNGEKLLSLKWSMLNFTWL